MEPKTFCQTSRDLINGIQLELNTYFTCGSNFDFYCRFQKYSKGRSHNIFRQTYIRYLQHPLQLLYVTPRFYGPSRCLQQPPSATSSPSPWSKAKGKSHPTWNTLIPTSLHIWKVKNHLWYSELPRGQRNHGFRLRSKKSIQCMFSLTVWPSEPSLWTSREEPYQIHGTRRYSAWAVAYAARSSPRTCKDCLIWYWTDVSSINAYQTENLKQLSGWFEWLHIQWFLWHLIYFYSQTQRGEMRLSHSSLSSSFCSFSPLWLSACPPWLSQSLPYNNRFWSLEFRNKTVQEGFLRYII